VYADRIGTIPIGGGRLELLQSSRQFRHDLHDLNHAGQSCRCIYVRRATASMVSRRGTFICNCEPELAIARDVFLIVIGRKREMMKPVTTRPNQILVRRRRVIMLLNQLYHH